MDSRGGVRVSRRSRGRGDDVRRRDRARDRGRRRPLVSRRRVSTPSPVRMARASTRRFRVLALARRRVSRGGVATRRRTPSRPSSTRGRDDARRWIPPRSACGTTNTHPRRRMATHAAKHSSRSRPERSRWRSTPTNAIRRCASAATKFFATAATAPGSNAASAAMSDLRAAAAGLTEPLRVVAAMGAAPTTERLLMESIVARVVLENVDVVEKNADAFPTSFAFPGRPRFDPHRTNLRAWLRVLHFETRAPGSLEDRDARLGRRRFPMPRVWRRSRENRDNATRRANFYVASRWAAATCTGPSTSARNFTEIPTTVSPRCGASPRTTPSGGGGRACAQAAEALSHASCPRWTGGTARPRMASPPRGNGARPAPCRSRRRSRGDGASWRRGTTIARRTRREREKRSSAGTHTTTTTTKRPVGVRKSRVKRWRRLAGLGGGAAGASRWRAASRRVAVGPAMLRVAIHRATWRRRPRRRWRQRRLVEVDSPAFRACCSGERRGESGRGGGDRDAARLFASSASTIDRDEDGAGHVGGPVGDEPAMEIQSNPAQQALMEMATGGEAEDEASPDAAERAAEAQTLEHVARRPQLVFPA